MVLLERPELRSADAPRAETLEREVVQSRADAVALIRGHDEKGAEVLLSDGERVGPRNSIRVPLIEVGL